VVTARTSLDNPIGWAGETPAKKPRGAPMPAQHMTHSEGLSPLEASRSRAALAVTIAAVVLGGALYATRGCETPPVIDLVQKLPAADKRAVGTVRDVFAVRDEHIKGDTRKSIYVHPPTRITWRVMLPDGAWLRTAAGVDEQAWDKDGDGVLFFVGITDGGRFKLLFERRIDPHALPGDRGWVPVVLDLSKYGGREVDLVFNTRTSLQGDDARNDFAYWAAPAICLRP
jgi:hypothetical protein